MSGNLLFNQSSRNQGRMQKQDGGGWGANDGFYYVGGRVRAIRDLVEGKSNPVEYLPHP